MGTITLYSVSTSQPLPPVIGQRVGNIFEGVWGVNDSKTIDIGSTTTTFSKRTITSLDSITTQSSLESVMSLEPTGIIPSGTGAGKDFNILSANKKYTIGCGFMQNRDNTFYLGCANGSSSGKYIATTPVSKNTFRYYVYKVIPTGQTELYQNECGIYNQSFSKTSSFASLTDTDITRVRMLLGYSAAEGTERWQQTLGMFFRPFCFEGETWFPFVSQPWKTGTSLFSCIVSYDDSTKLIVSVGSIIKTGYAINGVEIETLAAPKKSGYNTFITDKFIGMSDKYIGLTAKYNWNKTVTGVERFTQNGVPVPIAEKGYSVGNTLRFVLGAAGVYYLSRSGNVLYLSGPSSGTITFPEGEVPKYVLCLGVGGGASGSGGGSNANDDGIGGQAGGGCLLYVMVPEAPNQVTIVIGKGGGTDYGSVGEAINVCNAGSATYVNYGGYQITMNGGGERNDGGTVTYSPANSIMGAILTTTGATGTHGTGNGVAANSHPTGTGTSVGWSAYSGGPDPGGGGGGGASIFANGGTGGNSGSGKSGSRGSGGGGGSNSWWNRGYDGADGGDGYMLIYY